MNLKDLSPYTRFEFVAYILSGILILTILDQTHYPNFWFNDENLNLNLTSSVRLIVCSYIIGITIDTVSIILYEDFIFSKIFHSPASFIINGYEMRQKWRMKLTKLMYRKNFNEVWEYSNFISNDQALEDLVNRHEIQNFGVEERKKVERLRLQSELCRNMSLVSIITIIIYVLWLDGLIPIFHGLEFSYWLHLVSDVGLIFLISLGFLLVFTYRYSVHYFAYKYEIVKQMKKYKDDKNK